MEELKSVSIGSVSMKETSFETIKDVSLMPAEALATASYDVAKAEHDAAFSAEATKNDEISAKPTDAKLRTERDALHAITVSKQEQLTIYEKHKGNLKGFKEHLQVIKDVMRAYIVQWEGLKYQEEYQQYLSEDDFKKQDEIISTFQTVIDTFDVSLTEKVSGIAIEPVKEVLR